MSRSIQASIQARDILLKNYQDKQHEINQRLQFIKNIEARLINYKNVLKKRNPTITANKIKEALQDERLDELLQISAAKEYILLLNKQNRLILTNIETIYHSINAQEYSLSTSKLAYDLSKMLNGIAKIPKDMNVINDDIESNLDKTADMLDDMADSADQSLLNTNTSMQVIRGDNIVIDDSIFDIILSEEVSVDPVPQANITHPAKSMTTA